MKNRWLLLGLGLAALAVAGAGWLIASQPYAFHGSTIEPPMRVSDFTLTSHAGTPFRLADQTGNIVMLFFGYTSCPDFCPTTLMELKKVRGEDRIGERIAAIGRAENGPADADDAADRLEGEDPRAMTGIVPPRIYCIPAAGAPIVAVFRRGPTNWSHVGRWDLGERRYEAGAWLGGRIFPRPSDLSPDGRFLCYFAHKPSATWSHGEAYVAVSKLPWLTALHAFGTCGTWTRGYHFTEDEACENPEHPRLPIPYGLRSIPAVQFANERRRGWEEAPDSPQRDPGDAWDERHNARMRKRQPGGDRLLCVESRGWAGGEFGIGQAVDGLRVGYWLEVGATA